MTDTAYFDIAGFSIEIVYGKAQDTFAKRRIKRDILDLLHGFIVTKPNTIDYKIEFIDLGYIPAIYKPKKKDTYSLFYRQAAGKIVAYYYISIFQFQSLLQSILLRLLNKHDGFMIHCSAAIIDEKAHVFFGVSGAGKSTIIKLLHKNYLAIADDQLIVRKQNNHYFCYPSPYREKVTWILKNSNRFPLEAVYFLNKSSDFHIDKIKSIHPIVKLILNQVYTDHELKKGQVSIAMNFIFKFSGFYSIYFAKNQKKLLTLMESFHTP